MPPSSFGLSVALHKHYDEKELVAFFKSLETTAGAFYSMGITQSDREKFDRVLQQVGGAIGYVCIDVANGYTEAFVRFVEKFRQAHPQLTIFSDPPHIQV